MGVGLDNGNGGTDEYLIPTVSHEGTVMGDGEAYEYFRRTGEHMGIYDSPDASTAAGEAIHLDQVANPPSNTLARPKKSRKANR
jgi:hypothetical protein